MSELYDHHVLGICAQGYAYVLTHPGTPCIFYDHLWTDGMLKPSLWRRLRALLAARSEQQAGSLPRLLRPLRSVILQLLQLRRRAGLHCDSQVPTPHLLDGKPLADGLSLQNVRNAPHARGHWYSHLSPLV